jgi:uncharacterized protein YggE
MPENTRPARSFQLITIGVAIIALAVVFGVGMQVSNNDDDASPASSAAPSSTQQTGIVTTGTGSVDGTPDQLQFTATVTNSRASTDDALAVTNKEVREVTAAVKKQGVDAKDIRTTALSLSPAYDYSGGHTRIVGYRATIKLRVLVRVLKSAGKVIGAASGAGGNAASVGSIALKISDQKELIAQARAKAVKDARAAADAFADAAGRKVGKLLFVSEGTDDSGYQPQYDQGLDGLSMATARSIAADVPISAGQQSLSVTVQVRWAVD